VTWFEEWSRELERRAGLDEAELQRQPTWVLVLAGADRITQLNRVINNYGSAVDSPEGERLRTLYTRGPTLGLHLVLSFQAAASMKQCLDRAQLEHFKHRVVTQIAEGDSFLLLGNDHAAKLQRGESRPLFAIYHNQIAGTANKFKPYTARAQIPWLEQLRELKRNLNRWKEKNNVDG
jgi:S-DNA-T family DNA segregation ATPase FtsK/SpoIIIE